MDESTPPPHDGSSDVSGGQPAPETPDRPEAPGDDAGAAGEGDGLMDKAKPVIDKAGEVAGDLAEKAKPAIDKAGEVAGDLAEKAKPALDKAGEVAEDLLGKAKGFFKKRGGGDAGDA